MHDAALLHDKLIYQVSLVDIKTQIRNCCDVIFGLNIVFIHLYHNYFESYLISTLDTVFKHDKNYYSFGVCLCKYLKVMSIIIIRV